jgi:hypothetical protein
MSDPNVEGEVASCILMIMFVGLVIITTAIAKLTGSEEIGWLVFGICIFIFGCWSFLTFKPKDKS